MLRKLFLFLLPCLWGAFAPIHRAQEGSGPSLELGDAAPPLDLRHWVKGAEQGAFEPGTVTVVEFWATWCGPCVAGMEDLSLLQERYADRGVRIVGVSDEPLQTVVGFLCSPTGEEGRIQNDRVRYTLATDPNRSAWRAYMEAAQQRGVPMAFLIGKQGRVEWIGHPKDLNAPLGAVVADRWDREAHRRRTADRRARDQRTREAQDRLERAVVEERWDQAIAALDALIEEGEETFVPTKLAILLSKLRDRKRGTAYARELVAAAWRDNPWMLAQVAAVVTEGITTGGGKRSYPVEPALQDPDLGIRALERAVELEPAEYGYLSSLAALEHRVGRHAAAVAHQERALAALLAIEDRIRPHERSRYADHVARYERQLERYRRELTR